MADCKTQGLAAALILALASGCSHAPTPAWRSAAHDAVERYQRYYLGGESGLAQLAYQSAVTEASATGDPVQANAVRLTRCALETASLDFSPCPAFQADAGDPAQDAYLRFLQGTWTAADGALLPARYRAFAAAAGEPPARIDAILAQIDDPTSRLIAAGIAVERRNYDRATLQLAVDTASKEGWRRPLLTYLGYLKKIAEEHGDGGAAQRLQERIRLILEPLAGER